MIVTRHDPEHAYRDETGRRWPGVTSILGSVPPWLGRFDRVDPEVLEYKRQIGTAVHVAIDLDARGELDEDSVDPAVAPYLTAWRRFKAEKQFIAAHTERVVWHPVYGFAGTLDALGSMGHRMTLVDAKTGSDADADLAGPQTAAYLEAARAQGLVAASGIVDRFSVHLRADGTYRLVPHTYRRDWNVFLAALDLYNFQRRKAAA